MIGCGEEEDGALPPKRCRCEGLDDHSERRLPRETAAETVRDADLQREILAVYRERRRIVWARENDCRVAMMEFRQMIEDLIRERRPCPAPCPTEKTAPVLRVRPTKVLHPPSPSFRPVPAKALARPSTRANTSSGPSSGHPSTACVESILDAILSRINGEQKEASKGRDSSDASALVRPALQTLSICLMSFQEEGVRWLWGHLWKKNLNGILADEMGLGKTIQTIALLTVIRVLTEVSGPHLILAPLSVVSSWEEEFKRAAPGKFRVAILHGDVHEQAQTVKTMLSSKRLRTRNDSENSYGFDVIIVPHSVMAGHQWGVGLGRLLGRVQWNYAIIDEAQRIKNRESVLFFRVTKRIRSDHRLVLTGTPLQNQLGELWSLLSFLMPEEFTEKRIEQLSVYFAQLDGRGLLESASATRSQGGTEEEVRLCHQLHRLLQQLILRRERSQVLDQLPRLEEHFICCPMMVAQIQEMESKRQQGALTIAMARKILLHPFTLLGEFHVDERIVNASGKLWVMDLMLRFLLPLGHKCLVFCAWTTVLDVIEAYLWLRKWKYVRLDGRTALEDRKSRIAQFNEDPQTSLFLVSKGAGGVGLNLQSADTVFLYDVDYNPQRDIQALSRAHRIGQERDCKVFHLITNTQVERRMLQLAESKLLMERQVIHAGKYDLRSTIVERDQLLRLLKVEDFYAKWAELEGQGFPQQIAEALVKVLPRNEYERMQVVGLVSKLTIPTEATQGENFEGADGWGIRDELEECTEDLPESELRAVSPTPPIPRAASFANECASNEELEESSDA